MQIEAERFPEVVTMVAERFGDVTEDLNGACPKCGHDLDDPMWHSEIPAELGNGRICFDNGPSLCPCCGELPNECASWCDLARYAR